MKYKSHKRHIRGEYLNKNWPLVSNAILRRTVVMHFKDIKYAVPYTNIGTSIYVTYACRNDFFKQRYLIKIPILQNLISCLLLCLLFWIIKFYKTGFYISSQFCAAISVHSDSFWCFICCCGTVNKCLCFLNDYPLNYFQVVTSLSIKVALCIMFAIFVQDSSVGRESAAYAKRVPGSNPDLGIFARSWKISLSICTHWFSKT